MTDQTIRVGIVGAGANTARYHLPNLGELPGVEVVAVSNRSLESSQRVAREWDIPEVVGDWRSLVTHPGIDAVVIGTWPNMHHPVTIASLAANKHVLCEARMAMNATEAREMWVAARSRPHLVAQIVPSPLSFSVDATIRRLLSEDYLGELVSIDVIAHTGTFPETAAVLSWRHDADLSGLNVMSLGIWYESLMRWVGVADRVLAMGKTTVRRRRDSDGTLRTSALPDHLDVLAEMACGAQARFQFSDTTGISTEWRATLFGTEGVISFENGGLLGARRGDDVLRPLEVPEQEGGHWRVEEEFVNAIRGVEQVTLTDFATGVKYMEFTEAVWRSMRQGRTVSLPLDTDA